MINREQLISLFIKIGIPALIGISIKLAIESKNKKMTFFRVLLSFITGIGCAYLLYPLIEKNTDSEFIPLIIAIASISGEKIAEFVINKWNIDYFLGSIFETIRLGIIKFLTK